jgi:hypothetical protein
MAKTVGESTESQQYGVWRNCAVEIIAETEKKSV